jgi:hypothetical protein
MSWFGAPAASEAVELATVRAVLRRNEETGFGISIAENEHGDVIITDVASVHARQAGAESGAVILRVAGYDVEGRGLEAVHEAVALSPSAHQTEFVMRLGEELPPVITHEDVRAATVLQASFRGHRARQKLAKRQYDDARRQQVDSSGGLWGEVRYELGRDEHDGLLDRLDAMEHEIQRATTELSAYLDSRTARWSRPNAALAPSRSSLASGRVDEDGRGAERRPGEFQPGQLMSAWDQSRVTDARRKGLPAPTQSAGTVHEHAAAAGTRSGGPAADAVSSTRSGQPRPGFSPDTSCTPSASASPRRLSRSLAATLENSHAGVRVNRRTFV